MQQPPEQPEGGAAAAWPSASSGDSAWEIEEESEAAAGNGHTEPCRREGEPSGVRRYLDGDDVYVAVGKAGSSTDALAWALKHAAKPTGILYLVHVFNEVRHIPTPLGMLPKNQASPQQVETYMSQERAKRREMLQKFMDLCHSSKVEVDIHLIESDLITKAVVELIAVLNIRKLIVGTTKPSMRKLKKGNSKAEQIQKCAPHYCEVKIICDGREVAPTDEEMLGSSLSDNTTQKRIDNLQENRKRDSVSCNCFSGKFI